MITRTVETEELKNLLLRDAGAEQVAEYGLGLVKGLVEDDDATARLHPLGFLQIVLATYEEFSLRLHAWPLSPIPPKDPAWRVHLHGWELRSYVLCGAAINVEYEVTPDPSGPSQLYEVNYQSGVSVLEQTDERVRCREHSRKIYTAPAIYDVPRQAFHTTECLSGEPTATVVIIGPEKSSLPRVVGDVNGKATYARPMEMLRGDALHQKLASFL